MFYLVPLLGICSSIASLSLTCCLLTCKYLIVWLHFSNHRKVVFCTRHPMCLSSALPSVHESYMLSGCPLCRPGSIVAGNCGWFGRCDWPLIYLVAQICFLWRLLATDWQDWVMKWLVVKPQGWFWFTGRCVLGQHPGDLRMLSVHQWVVKLDPRAHATQLEGRTMSWVMDVGPKLPRSLVGEAHSWPSWL